MKEGVTLVGDGIENPANALVMAHAAQMFGAACRFRDTKGLAQSAEAAVLSGQVPSLGAPASLPAGPEAAETPARMPAFPVNAAPQGQCPDPPALAATFPAIETDEIGKLHSRIVAFDNLPGAAEVYGYQAGPDFTVLLGNERRGLSYECAKLATDKVQVPMISRRINCLNVAAASAVALYYLRGTRVGPMTTRGEPGNRRPEVLLLGPGDHVELGSAIRSTAAFGWSRVFVEDRGQVWFGCDRAVRSEGRAAARRGRNEILCIPCPAGAEHGCARVTIITAQPVGIPVHRVNLARGPSQLIVIPDEGSVDHSAETWSRLGKEVEFAHLQIPSADFPYHYRLLATIALAEISRQVGRRPAAKAPPAARPPIYDHRLERLAEAAGQMVSWEELVNY